MFECETPEKNEHTGSKANLQYKALPTDCHYNSTSEPLCKHPSKQDQNIQKVNLDCFSWRQNAANFQQRCFLQTTTEKTDFYFTQKNHESLFNLFSLSIVWVLPQQLTNHTFDSHILARSTKWPKLNQYFHGWFLCTINVNLYVHCL